MLLTEINRTKLCKTEDAKQKESGLQKKVPVEKQPMSLKKCKWTYACLSFRTSVLFVTMMVCMRVVCTSFRTSLQQLVFQSLQVLISIGRTSTIKDMVSWEPIIGGQTIRPSGNCPFAQWR